MMVERHALGFVYVTSVVGIFVCGVVLGDTAALVLFTISLVATLFALNDIDSPGWLEHQVAAVEAEARAGVRADLRAKVEALRLTVEPDGFRLSSSDIGWNGAVRDVLELLSEE